MKYSCKVTINMPRDDVIALFEDPEVLPKWQEGFLSIEEIEGPRGEAGGKSRLRYQMGKREIEMVETILVHDPPERFDATYEAKGVWNLNQNYFTAPAPGITEWLVETEFRCKGVMWIMSLVMPGMFRKQTQKMMEAFKAYAERGVTV